MAATRLRLAHLHLPSATPTPYLTASALQDVLVRRFLDFKASGSSSKSPDPIVVTFSPPPTYTLGRRHAGPSSPPPRRDSQPAPNEVATGPFDPDNMDADAAEKMREILLQPDSSTGIKPELHSTLRGGQTTFHGPGQLVAYPILDLTALTRPVDGSAAARMSARCYVRLLENSIMSLLRSSGYGYKIPAYRTSNPGVWTAPDEGTEVENTAVSAHPGAVAKKIAALGVHLRRHITSHGVAINITDEPLPWFKRIVACGLVGREATSLTTEIREQGRETSSSNLLSVDQVASQFVESFARALAKAGDNGGAPGGVLEVEDRMEGLGGVEIYDVGLNDVGLQDVYASSLESRSTSAN